MIVTFRDTVIVSSSQMRQLRYGEDNASSECKQLLCLRPGLTFLWPPGGTAPTGTHGMAEPLSLLLDLWVLSQKLPWLCLVTYTHCCPLAHTTLPRVGMCQMAGKIRATGETMLADIQLGRCSSTHKPTQPIGPTTEAVLGLSLAPKIMSRYKTVPLKDIWAPPGNRSLRALGHGNHGGHLEAEDSPPPSCSLLPFCRGRQALPALDMQTTLLGRQDNKTSSGGHSPCPAQHKGVFDHDHWAQLGTFRVVVLAAVFTPCKQTSDRQRTHAGRETPKGYRTAPRLGNTDAPSDGRDQRGSPQIQNRANTGRAPPPR